MKIPSLPLSPLRELDLEWALDIGIGIAAYTIASSPKAGWFPKFQKYPFRLIALSMSIALLCGKLDKFVK